ncbi:hypothetical protein SYNPS1DRAFT_22905 [Syncephalis pseudoplumigaleata]|uniref:RRM domain-containing protein n=1 Tax=Syncephalis pseudoplumigaleata TaxID=1712513 RepID=A0A4P9YZP0_9FUNG|nr:hypothetical protein SYNPS1DRAFT_22905 [Syncephalis pseudoplumigaleata]|eukprot:RKP25072.1 hypothetical protein SYNPS1DRAFT_22905 [Syncephalis pseudoplumigaleata]
MSSLRRSSQAANMPLPPPPPSTLSGSTSPFVSMHAMDQSGMSPSPARHVPTSPAGLSFGGVWSPSHGTLSLTAVAAQPSINQNGFGPSNYGAAAAAAAGQASIDDMYATLPRTPIMSPASAATAMPYDTPMSPMSPLSPAFPVTLLPFPPPQSVAMDHSKTNSNGGSQRMSLPSTPISGSLTPNQSPMRQPCRTIYLGGLPANTEARDILEQIRAHGVIESIRMLPERGCAFISFLSASAASAFHNDYAGSHGNGNGGSGSSSGATGPVNGGSNLARRSLVVNGQEIKVSWGKPSPVPLHVLRAAEEDGATRAVFISSLAAEDTEPRVRAACEQFGEVETLRWFPDRRIAFVHFTSIADAVRCVAWFRSSSDQWLGRQVGYGRDRCVLVNGALQPDGPSTGLSQLDRMDLGRGAKVQS